MSFFHCVGLSVMILVECSAALTAGFTAPRWRTVGAPWQGLGRGAMLLLRAGAVARERSLMCAAQGTTSVRTIAEHDRRAILT